MGKIEELWKKHKRVVGMVLAEYRDEEIEVKTGLSARTVQAIRTGRVMEEELRDRTWVKVDRVDCADTLEPNERIIEERVKNDLVVVEA